MNGVCVFFFSNPNIDAVAFRSVLLKAEGMQKTERAKEFGGSVACLANPVNCSEKHRCDAMDQRQDRNMWPTIMAWLNARKVRAPFDDNDDNDDNEREGG